MKYCWSAWQYDNLPRVVIVLNGLAIFVFLGSILWYAQYFIFRISENFLEDALLTDADLHVDKMNFQNGSVLADIKLQIMSGAFSAAVLLDLYINTSLDLKSSQVLRQSSFNSN